MGKTFQSFVAEGCADYEQRIKHYVPFEHILLPDVKHGKKHTMDSVREAEAKVFLAQIDPTDLLFLLDEKGKEFTSFGMAHWLEKKFHDPAKRLVFAIGGAFGFAPEMRERANGSIALSQLTFSHQLVRLVFLEQLYRTLTIIKGEPYHNG